MENTGNFISAVMWPPCQHVKVSIIIHTMLNFDRDGHCDGDGIGACKLTLRGRLHQT